MSKVLLINPSYQPSYGGARASIVNPIHPTLGLATIAAVALERGHSIEILDMSWLPYSYDDIKDKVLEMRPDIVGITATTPLMNQLRDISVLIKDIAPETLLVGGGAHPTALPTETLHESLLDVVCFGEADFTFADVCDGLDYSKIKGIAYRDGKSVIVNEMRPAIGNLDNLPMPAWQLYEIKEYEKVSRLIAKNPPITMAEFSRGCVFKCDFCASKMTMALGYRKKSPERCAAEVKKMYELGFREFMLADDIFTSDQKWAVAVCQAISDTGLEMSWSCTNGIRVESADENLFNMLRKAGCYRVSFGFESGSDEVLTMFGKGGRASIEQGRKAVQMARDSGIDTNGFFLLGLSPDTEKTMQETIEYARQLPLDMMKFGVSIAFPGSKMYNDYVDDGLINSYDWDEYFIYTDKPLFKHKHLDYKTIQHYMKEAYNRAILLNPGFMLRRIIRGLKTAEFFWDVYYFLKFVFMPSVGETTRSVYYAQDRWPKWDFENKPPQRRSYQTIKK